MPAITFPARRTRRRMLLTAVAAAAVAGALAIPARGAELTMFPERDFVEVGGLAIGDLVDLEVIRAGVIVGRVNDLAAFDDAGTVIALVNHPAAPPGVDRCWEAATPDIQPGDVIRATITGPSAGVDEATVANVTVTQPAQLSGTTVTVRGTAQTAAGAQLPLADIEQRLIHAPGGDLFDNGKRRLSTAGEGGTLAYDSPGAVTWTATYATLSPADQAEAVAAESRILHFAKPLPSGAFGAVTIFEYGVPGGPGMPQCPPLEVGPTLDLPADADTGASSTDNVTRVAAPVLVGARGSASPSATITLNRMTGAIPTPLASTTMNAAGGFAFALAAPLADGRYELRAGQIGNAPGNPQILGGPLALTVDTTAPTGIAVQGAARAAADDNAPLVRGFAEQGTTVRLYGAPGCADPPIGTGDAATFASTGIGVAVADNSRTVFHATAEDLAGNVSACVAAGTVYREVSPLARLLTARLRATASWRARLTIACNALVTSQCSGRVALTVKVTRGGKKRQIVIGAAPYRVQGGRTLVVPVALNRTGRALLSARRAIRAGARIRPAAGSGLAATSRSSLILLGPRAQ